MANDPLKPDGDPVVCRVFLSSTAEDLHEHRERVLERLATVSAVRSINQETFGALGRPTVVECTERAATADLLVVVLAHRYGWVPSIDEGGDGVRSITWLEVDAAREAGVQVLTFVVDTAYAWRFAKEQDNLLTVSDDDAVLAVGRRVKKLQDFRLSLASRPWENFTSPNDLAAKVTAAVANELVRRRFPTGMVRTAELTHRQEWHTTSISVSHPAAILYIVDQSTLMATTFADGAQKAQLAADAVNTSLQNLVLQCARGDEIRNYFEIGVLGYGDEVRGVLPFDHGSTAVGLWRVELIAEHPLRFAPQSLPSDPELQIDMPIWLEPRSAGRRRLSDALDVAGRLLVSWVNEHEDSFPPLVIHISAGGLPEIDPTALTRKLRELHTNDGPLLLFTALLSGDGRQEVHFPSTPAELHDIAGATYFEMTSPLTPYMMSVAHSMGFEVRPNARGILENADARTITEFLDVGTHVRLIDW